MSNEKLISEDGLASLYSVHDNSGAVIGFEVRKRIRKRLCREKVVRPYKSGGYGIAPFADYPKTTWTFKRLRDAEDFLKILSVMP